MNHTRKDLQDQGWTYHAGYTHPDNGRFHYAGMPTDAVPPFPGDLKAMGWIDVPNGMMEPPKPSLQQSFKGIVVLGVLAAGVYWLHKRFEPAREARHGSL